VPGLLLGLAGAVPADEHPRDPHVVEVLDAGAAERLPLPAVGELVVGQMRVASGS
jgi:hypothetical protein